MWSGSVEYSDVLMTAGSARSRTFLTLKLKLILTR
jgi:hypothetical protein